MKIETPGAWRALTMATLAFAANFSVWTLYAVIGLELQQRLHLNSTELGLLFAAPMLTGAVARIPAGFLAEKYSPKKLYFWQMLVAAPPLFMLPYLHSLTQYMVVGLWIGISGTSFTLGIRYVTDWFDRNSQGTAMGIFGAGNAGAAITLIFAPQVVAIWGWQSIGPVYGAGLIFIALLFGLFAPASNLGQSAGAAAPRVSLRQALLTPQIWRFSLYYYFVFGSFLALILWLPQYYANVYKLNLQQALAFTLLFVATSSMVRALGGWFADKYGGRSVNWSVFWICIVCLFFLSYPPTTMTIHGVEHDVHLNIEVNLWVFTLLIFVIGLAQGFGRASVYKVIHDYYPNQMGSIGGIVAAVGALGGCTLPILFGLAVDIIGIYSACFMILYGVLAACMITMFFAIKTERYKYRVADARAHNFLDDD